MAREGSLRFGILGAARIAPLALLLPARDVPGAEVVAVAARDPQRAAAFAAKHAIPAVAPDYAALLERPEVDVVYNALPTALHDPNQYVSGCTRRALRCFLRSFRFFELAFQRTSNKSPAIGTAPKPKSRRRLNTILASTCFGTPS